jgi:23S rRNA (cytidine1920-2'-O)/16S rRNA (cytidine1409-2'-O)-methyltransferase
VSPRGARLDEHLVALGLAETRSRAEALIRTGRVLVDDVPVEKPGTRVRPDVAVRLRGETRRFVSRGGEKLAGALEDLGVDPAGKLCLDVGASTGGFSDCLLQAGARGVVAVDVGYGQLAEKLRNDSRVRVLERTNARHLTPGDVPAGIELVTLDVSFISARLVLPALCAVAPRADLLLMVKPQFEVGREQVGKGGVVREPELRAQAVRDVAQAAEALGWGVRGQADSRLAGPKGNLEIFLWLSPQPTEKAEERSGSH